MKGDPKKEEKDVLKRRKILEEPFKKVAFAFVRTTIIILVIFYLGILLISRTAGFRSIIAERLESRLGVPFEIGGSGFDTRLNLHTRDIKSTAPLLESGHIQVDQLSTFWSLAGLLSKEEPLVHKIVLDGVSLQVVATEKNGWQPGVFGMLGKIDGFAQMAGSSTKAAGTNEVAAVEAAAKSKTEATSKRFHSILIIQNSQINLMQGDGRRVANFGDVDFQYVPGFNEGLEVQLFKLDGNYVMVNSKVPRQKLELEVLNAGDEVMVKRLRAGADLLVSLAGFLGGDDVAEVVPPPVIASQELDRPTMDPILALETPAVVPDESHPGPGQDSGDASSARVEHLHVQPLPTAPPRVINVGTLTAEPALPPTTDGHSASIAAASTNDVADEIISQIEAIFNPVATNGAVDNLVKMNPPTAPDHGSVESHPEGVGVREIPVSEPLLPVPEPVVPEPIPTLEPVVVHTPPVSVPPLKPPPVPSGEEGFPLPVVAPALAADIPPAIAPPNVLSEIEKVLEDAMRMQEESLKRREVAERKFAAISNQYLVISNEIERAVDP